MAYWEYRIITCDLRGGKAGYALHEVYCDNEGKPIGIDRPAIAVSESVEGLQKLIATIALGASKPVLDGKLFSDVNEPKELEDD